MNILTRFRPLIALVCILLLNACGGSGGSGSAFYLISGSVTGLRANQAITLVLNGTITTTSAANGAFSFNTPLPVGSAFTVAVSIQPVGQICSVSNGSGIVTANSTSVAVSCADQLFTIGGTLSGLPAASNVSLQLNGDTPLLLGNNGAFVFSAALTYGVDYVVTVSVAPKNYVCAVQNGSGTITMTVTNVVVSCSLISAFAASPILLPDLRAKYNQLCGDNTEVRVSTANMSNHTDNRRDIIAVMWCMINPVGQVLPNTVPTPNGMVVFRQRSDGTFYDATAEIFGVDMVDVGGALGEEHIAVYDMNHDGYDEIVISPTGEDGRSLSPSDPATWNNKQAVFLTSLGDGHYRVDKLGIPSYGSRDDLVDNRFGSEDVITTVIGYGGSSEAWRYANSGWAITHDYDSLNGELSGLYFPRSSPNAGASVHIAPTSTTSLQLYSLTSNGTWTAQSAWSLSPTVQASYVSWNGDIGNLAISTINGKDYGFLAFNRPCAFQFNTNSPMLAVYAVPASEVTGGYHGQLLHESSSDFQTHNLILGFSVADGNITPVDLGLKNEIVNLMGLRFDCFDVNHDGYQDLIISNWGVNSQPLVYLNGGDNTLSSIKLSTFPVGSTNFNSNTSIIVDIDGDGIPDLLVYPLNGLINSPSSVQFQIYKGQRYLGNVDLN